MIDKYMLSVEFDDLIQDYGKDALKIFQELKTDHKPAIPLTQDFAIQVANALPKGFAKVDPSGTEWRLYNPDSDSMLEWAECHRLILPNGCYANIEVLDYTYYVDVQNSDGDVPECENCDCWDEIAPVIEEFYNNI